MSLKFTIYLLVLLALLGGPVRPLPGATLQVIPGEEIRKVVEGFLRQRASGLGIDLHVKKIDRVREISVPEGTIDYEVMAPQQWEGWGNGNLAVIVRVDGKVRENIPLRIEVEALSDMVVTTRQIEQGEVIGPSDVTVKKRDLATSGGKICRNPADVVGKRLKSALRGNMPVRSDQLEKIPLVKNGQVVTILLENDLIRLTATGRSKGTGAAGDTIIVQNSTSQKDIPAKIVDGSTVRVEF
jgi:flagella basal body P-ring formation protein FlgA